jgi:hypothetical protein
MVNGLPRLHEERYDFASQTVTWAVRNSKTRSVMKARMRDLLVPANSFAEYAPEPNPETKKKDVVWFAERGSAAVRLRWHLDDIQRRSWHQVQADTGAASSLWVLDDGTECDCRADPSEGDAGDPDHG